ncbi:phage terminase, small subunit, putative, P27 family [Hoeflea sp. IMCC20628]|uniref:phage terminase small subunit P27 family n=1 Tax=Hoeflea sp. IMCC20628 TaxID=1620421 RepID=UPI00063AF6EF|nr:phage terminase small subunit P27 family [Hoeflea sp. IMCC20628]AKI01434.1 phage terminase, small subunit, putative, P27 family [Hoeflea sp. IMCC20628]
MTRGLKPSTITPGTSPVVRVPSAPSYLSKEAKSEWRRVAPILVRERKVLTVADLATLENFVIASGTMREMHTLLQAEGYVLPNGKRHPAVGILTAMQQQQLRCAGELGLTPTARSRAVMIGTDDDDDDNPLAVT